MSVVCSDNNLAELNQINNDLEECAFLLRLLFEVPHGLRSDAFHSLLDTYICRVGDVAFSLRIFERCIRTGFDMNAEPPTTE